MPASTPTARAGYWPTVLVMLLATCPSLINVTALDLLTPSIAQSLGVSPADAMWVWLLGNAALAVGFAFGAEFTRRQTTRRHISASLLLLAVASVCAALAPNLQVLVVAHCVQALCAGVLVIALIPPLLTRFPANRLPVSVSIVAIGLFVSSMFGPVVGGLVQQTETWRVLFGIDALLGLVAIPLTLDIPRDEAAADRRTRVDVASLLLAAIGIILVSVGLGELSWHVWTAPEVAVPVVLALAAFVTLFVVEFAQRDALLRVPGLARPMPLSAILLACTAGFGFGGLLALLLAFMQRVRGLDAQDTGLLLWPAPVAALVGAVLVGGVYRERRLTVGVAVGGLVLLAVAAWVLTDLTAFTGDVSIGLVSALVGLGAAVCVVAAMLIAAYSVPPELARGALGIVLLLSYMTIAWSAPFVTYFVSVWQTIHFGHLVWQQADNLAFDDSSTKAQALAANANLLFTATSASHGASTSSTSQPTGVDTHLLMKSALALGMNDAAFLLLAIICVGLVVTIALLLLNIIQSGTVSHTVRHTNEHTQTT